jgi:hypothetical protein
MCLAPVSAEESAGKYSCLKVLHLNLALASAVISRALYSAVSFASKMFVTSLYFVLIVI